MSRAKVCRRCLTILLVGASTELAYAQSQNICDAILTSKTFNVYDSKDISNYQSHALDDMCNVKWRSVAEFNNSAKSLDSAGTYEDISGFLKLNSNDVSASLNTIYDKLWEKKRKTASCHFFFD
jgi:hypothetical protein